MESKGIILLVEPDGIVGLELKMELENAGYSVSQSKGIKHTYEFVNKEKLKAIIVNIDRADGEDFVYLKKHFPLTDVSLIAISSGAKQTTEYDGISFIKTFLKPFDSKKLVLQMDKHFYSDKIE